MHQPRTIALKRVYQANGQKAEDYKAWLRENAGQFGLTPEAVDGLAKPVLVRLRQTPVNRAEFARQANALYGAYMAERSRLSARVGKQENTRGDVFKSDFEDMLDMLTTLDLSRMGVGRSLAPPTPYSGGTSKSDKEEYEADTDRIAPRFARGMFENSETQKPDTSRANEQVRED